MAARSKARKRAVDIMYEAELRGVALSEVVSARRAAADPPVNDYTVHLVETYQGHVERIDELLSEHAQGWTLDRMPPVDRNILRLGALELLYVDEVPDAVAVAEAVELARELSTDDSPAYVNGLLGRLMELKPTLPQ